MFKQSVTIHHQTPSDVISTSNECSRTFRALELQIAVVYPPRRAELLTTDAQRYYVCSLFSWGLLTEQAVAEARKHQAKRL